MSSGTGPNRRQDEQPPRPPGYPEPIDDVMLSHLDATGQELEIWRERAEVEPPSRQQVQHLIDVLEATTRDLKAYAAQRPPAR